MGPLKVMAHAPRRRIPLPGSPHPYRAVQPLTFVTKPKKTRLSGKKYRDKRQSGTDQDALDDIQEDGSFWTKIPPEDQFHTHTRI